MVQREVTLAGRYRLEEPLGRGGMGEVWRGVDVRLRRPVAVKILPLAIAAEPAGVARFRREAEVAATLNHPGITTVFDIDEHRDGNERWLFLVMELMVGRDMRHLIAAHPEGLPIEQVKELAGQVADALAAAHRRGVVHRDIKPANLFLLEEGRVKICDFGIARFADATKITATGSSAGTPLYMAPEQIQGAPVDHRTDLYAFGCVLYELLTGTPWIDTASNAGNVGAILYKHLNQTPASPRSTRAEIPGHLDTLVLDLLAKQPDARPPDAACVAERLRQSAHEPHQLRGSQSPAADPHIPLQPDAPRPAQTVPAEARGRGPEPRPASGALATAAVAGLVGGVADLLLVAASAYFIVTHVAGLNSMVGLVLRLVAGAAMLGGGVLLLRRRVAGRRVLATGAGLALLVIAALALRVIHSALVLNPAIVVCQYAALISAIVALGTVYTGSVSRALDAARIHSQATADRTD
jgi:hypothetical protein